MIRAATFAALFLPFAAVSGATLLERLDRVVVPSVTFDGLELKRVAASLAAVAQELDPNPEGPPLNILVVDPDERLPEVRVNLHDLPLRRILELIAESVDFACEFRSDAVVIRPGSGPGSLVTDYIPVSRAVLAQTTGLGLALPAPAPNTKVEAKPGPAAEADALKVFLRQAGIDFGEEGSSVAYDGSGMIVTQTLGNLDRIRRVFRRYADVRQVEIEARFMEVEQGALDELGFTWSLAKGGETYDTSGTTRSLSRAFSGAQSDSAITINGVRVAGTQPPHLPGAVQVGDSAAPLASIDTAIGEFDVNAVIRALAQKQGSDLLSAPRVTVLSGQPATITVAQEMRYPQSYGEIQSQVGSTAGGGSGGSGSAGVTITSGTPQDFAMRRVGVELRCTATVESDGQTISLDLNPRVTEFEGFVEYGGPSLAISAGTSVTVPPGFYQPVFSVREVETRVALANGATLVMGGLTREERKQVDDRVPLLGSLPLLGRLFRSKAESSQKKTLLIFVTARLVDPRGSSSVIRNE